MTIRRLLLYFLFTLTLWYPIASPSSAQTDDQIWFWAWHSYELDDIETLYDQRGDVFAYTPDGMTVSLLENVYPAYIERISDSTAFVIAGSDELYSLYYMTPSGAQYVIDLFTQSYVEEYQREAIYSGFSFYAPEIIPVANGNFLIGDTRQEIYLIYDPTDDSYTEYDLRSWCDDNCVRVSEDGRYIRYHVTPTDDSLPYQLYEFDTETNTELLLFEQEEVSYESGDTPPWANCTPDQFGERWYCELYLDDGINWIGTADEKFIIYSNENIEVIDSDWQLRILNNQWHFIDLDRDRSECDPCTISVFPDGDETQMFQFIIPSRDEFNPWYGQAILLSEEHLIPNPVTSPTYAMSPHR